MAKVGRPPKIPERDMPELVKKFEEYIELTDVPIVAHFAAQHKLTKQYMLDREEFSDLVKRCTTKKEAALEIGMLTGTLNATGSIFSLKQLGWRDKEAKIVFVDPKTLSDDELKKLISDGN